MSLSIADLAGEYHQGWVGRDADTIAALHTEDSTFHIHGLADPAVGRGPVRDLIASLLLLVPDLHFEAKRFYVGSDHIVLEYDMSGTSDGSHFVWDGRRDRRDDGSSHARTPTSTLSRSWTKWACFHKSCPPSSSRGASGVYSAIAGARSPRPSRRTTRRGQSPRIWDSVSRSPLQSGSASAR